ncbi:hypothetical protein [Salinirussus salinus]|uniref:hypothetical protein n=1 Tax=Salinirussus salinus TaxID=1198300 RepID=UPI0034A376B1
MVDEERSALLKRRLEGGECRTEFDDELPDCADINGVEIGLVELKRFRNGFRKLRARCRFVPFDFLGFARVFVEGAGNREPTEILVVVENPDASLGEPVELCREITFCLARFARIACEELGKQCRFVRVGQPHSVISFHEVFVLKITDDLRCPTLTLVDRIG